MNKKNLWLVIFLGLAVFLGAASLVLAQSNNSDAIAVRIIPNPNHYSISRWYESQGFNGSPQSLLVDGYEAIRDGRTVYVNAANLSGTNIFINVYLISYNQNPTAATVDILGQIVSHWKFNNNLNNPSELYHCSISAFSCASDADCAPTQICATSTPAAGSCVLKEPKTCLVDTDCPSNFFCDSVKAKISRDLKRIGKIEELKEALFKFKSLNNSYPSLSAGTYLAGHSLSVWPSWSQVLLSELAVDQSFFDPINRLGACPGYDPQTCWDKDKKEFFSTPGNSTLTLPPNSYAMAYSSDPNGSNYNLCAVLESREPALGLTFSPNDPTSSACVTMTGIISPGTATNTAPQLVDKYLIGEAGREFNGFIKVIDREKNPLTWKINESSLPGWTGGPILKDTSNPEQKKVYAAKAGAPGEYNITLTVSDGDKSLSTTTPIKIVAPSPFIEADNAEYVLDQTVPFTYSFSFFSNNIDSPESAYSVARVSGPGGLDILRQAGTPKVSLVGSNKYRVDYSGLISPSFRLYQDASFVYRITVTDKYGQNPSSKEFLIRVMVEEPPLGFNCLNAARRNQEYKCLLGSTVQGNHKVTYTQSGLPSGLSLEGGTDPNAPVARVTDGRFFSRLINNLKNIARSLFAAPEAIGADDWSLVYIQGRPGSAAGSISEVTIKATNEYGASSTKAFILKVNDFCGDGLLQAPNTEGRGGVYNDGYEDCDGAAGVASSVESSSVDNQYGCVTQAGAITPNPIPTGNYCVFKSPIDGGGYCGDTFCQTKILLDAAAGGLSGWQNWENAKNCPFDCAEKSKCVPNCAGKSCGSDGCGGSCGGCNAGQVCDSSNHCVNNIFCQPNCSGKECGDNGCGGSCGSCPGYQICSAYRCINPGCNRNGVCQENLGENCAVCPIDCVCGDAFGMTCDQRLMKCVSMFNCEPQCTDKVCGSNSCGGTCGTCGPGQVCSADGKSCCSTNCESPLWGKMDCGDAGCGLSCGDCSSWTPMGYYVCTRKQKCCLPNCENDGNNMGCSDNTRYCGSDGCGGICGVGVCPTGQTCDDRCGTCVEKEVICLLNGVCESNRGENCSNCGDCACDAGEVCDTDPQIPTCACEPSCEGKECGDAGCGGGSCGECPAGETCQGNQCIGAVCSHAINCIGKSCGPDGCGDVCGYCPAGQTCNASGNCTKPAYDNLTGGDL